MRFKKENHCYWLGLITVFILIPLYFAFIIFPYKLVDIEIEEKRGMNFFDVDFDKYYSKNVKPIAQLFSVPFDLTDYNLYYIDYEIDIPDEMKSECGSPIKNVTIQLNSSGKVYELKRSEIFPNSPFKKEKSEKEKPERFEIITKFDLQLPKEILQKAGCTNEQIEKMKKSTPLLNARENGIIVRHKLQFSPIAEQLYVKRMLIFIAWWSIINLAIGTWDRFVIEPAKN